MPGTRRARRHAGDERCGGKVLATEEGIASEQNGVNWAPEAHLGVAGRRPRTRRGRRGGGTLPELRKKTGLCSFHGSGHLGLAILKLQRKNGTRARSGSWRTSAYRLT